MEENTIQQQISARKGANILVKMLATLLVPMLVIVIMAVLALRAVGSDTAEKMVNEELKAMSYVMNSTLESMAPGAISVKDGSLYKGEANITENQTFLDEFMNNTNISVGFFWGTDCMATSIKDEAGNRLGDISVSNEISSSILGGEALFIPAIKINGEEYYAYFSPLYSETGSTAGMLMTATPIERTTRIYQRIMTGNVIFMIVLIAVFSLLTAGIVILLVKAIMAMVRNIDRVADGELNFAISKKLLARSDEVGKIARSVHSVIVGFSQVLNGILVSMRELNDFSNKFQERFETIGCSISNVNIAVDEVARGAT